MNAKTISELIERQEPGHTLEQPFYIDNEIFQRDLECIVNRQWLFVDHVSRVSNPGDYFLYEIAGESIIVVRAEDGDIHAHFNVCRHRGSRVCIESEGRLNRFVCPYHAWAYALDGPLLSARQMPQDFDTSSWHLHRCAVRVFEGLIYVSLSDIDRAADFDLITMNLCPYVAAHGLAKSKIACRRTYSTDANWKLVVENFRECYHCLPAHPEYTAVNAYVRANEKVVGAYGEAIEEWNVKASAMGSAVGLFDSAGFDIQPHGAQRQPIRDGYLSLTQDGKPAAPLMGDFKQYDGGETFVYIGPLHYMSLANDHGTLFRFTPVTPVHTEVMVTWLVDETAREGVDYQVEHLKWMWDVTTVEDTKIINNNQQGVNSRRYRPGPYSMREGFTQRFTEWYLDQIKSECR
ncbi:MAG: aromatic ring-hydroxylating dioxygenase subunit alpha [Gammaproteobacteria bacterium]|nr:aromatic ring-hydroxylating dioxygenase subunit alpha [Gammaproteobacteria bacterium]